MAISKNKQLQPSSFKDPCSLSRRSVHELIDDASGAPCAMPSILIDIKNGVFFNNHWDYQRHCAIQDIYAVNVFR